jgi:hypothetical protein
MPRLAQAEDWRAVRALRLRALADAPDAFEITLAQAEQWTDEDWRRRAAEGDERLTFVEEDDDGNLGGMAVGLSSNQLLASLISSVCSSSRGGGVPDSGEGSWRRLSHGRAKWMPPESSWRSIPKWCRRCGSMSGAASNGADAVAPFLRDLP